MNQPQTRVPEFGSVPKDGIVAGEIPDIIKLVRKIAPTRASVLVTGESGTGKEVISQLLHQWSNRPEGPNVCINCAALPESLIESELFGHRRGAFTGADQDRIGCFESASGGTLLLDEISEIPATVQAKLLRVLETGAISRVGSTELVPVNVRIVATSNRELGREVEAGRFRLDLFHRLNVIQIELPPLRKRPSDIVPLAMRFLAQFAGELSIATPSLDPNAVKMLQSWPWPGNIRELRNTIYRATILCDGDRISVDHLGLAESPADQPLISSLPMTLEEIERRAILDALKRHSFNRSAAAQELGITTRTIFNKLQKFELGEAGESENGGPSIIRFAS